MGQRVTLEDIARQTGVSPATVSLVLRDKAGVNEETRRRVIEAARALGYRRRGGYADADVQQIGLMLKGRPNDQPQTNPFYAPIVAGIEAACRRLQINLLYATVPVDLDNHPLEVPRMVLEERIGGLLLLGAFVDHTIETLLQEHAVPTVLVDAYATEHDYDAIVSDNFRGAYEAVTYLIQQGHQDIGIVGSLASTYPSIEQRRRGYVQALLDQGVPQRYFADCHLSREEAAQATAELLRRYPQVTALFCSNDEIAIGAIQAARAAGRSLPGQLSIVGFDNIDLAEHISPPLTTMHIDKVSMGRLAVQLLVNRIEYPDAGCVTAVLRPTLIERLSVRAIGAEE